MNKITIIGLILISIIAVALFITMSSNNSETEVSNGGIYLLEMEVQIAEVVSETEYDAVLTGEKEMRSGDNELFLNKGDKVHIILNNQSQVQEKEGLFQKGSVVKVVFYNADLARNDDGNIIINADRIYE